MRSSVLIGALLTASFTASSGAQQRPVRNDADWQGRNGKQYVAVVATDTLMAYALN